MQENDAAGAAGEIKRGAAFLKLKAAQAGHVAKTDLDAAGNDLKDLASKVESGTVKDVKELDQGIKKAVSGLTKKKE